MHMTLREVVTAVMAGILVVTYCAIVLYEAINGKPYNVPDAFFAIVVSVVSYFFGQHASTNGAYVAGATAAQAAAATVAANSKPNGPGA